MIRLIAPLIPALRRYARALLRDASAADDLVQDCLERVISRWHQRRGPELRGWAFTILHNLAVNRLRQRQRRGPHLPVEEVEDPALTTPAPQESALYERDVMNALNTLPEDQRAVLLLISVEELSYGECAEVLGIPIGTVMSRLARGRERLRLRLESPPSSRRNDQPHLRSVK
ncbi:sigma-70 family RNA polymerase sigma factor [Thioclava sp. BHET1]|nr:sigma-70 family RNA polymerase sigma factor [Thioclava sp. BHET1]